MTDRTDEIRAREQAATEGPWEWRESDDCGLGNVYYHHERHGVEYPVPGCGHCGMNDQGYETPDGEFIAHARQDIPWLLAQVAERDAMIAAARDVIAAVRELHEMARKSEDRLPFCVHDGRLWPCPTVKALGVSHG